LTTARFKIEDTILMALSSLKAEQTYIFPGMDFYSNSVVHIDLLELSISENLDFVVFIFIAVEISWNPEYFIFRLN
jgi:hypothetical protein